MNVIEKLILFFGGLAIILLVATIGGTIVYLVWPVAVKAFPALVESGILAAKLTWEQAVLLTWLFGILFKSNAINHEKD